MTSDIERKIKQNEAIIERFHKTIEILSEKTHPDKKLIKNCERNIDLIETEIEILREHL